jgi:hypothetical protein
MYFLEHTHLFTSVMFPKEHGIIKASPWHLHQAITQQAYLAQPLLLPLSGLGASDV